uniref:Uncharacterized protein n=1 Tax=Oryza sativa subsp. japonica TaxID=39947 RepID=Q6AT04_ORYSJ|nr:hypothetical protein [Oryza sativa Japonica Group]
MALERPAAISPPGQAMRHGVLRPSPADEWSPGVVVLGTGCKLL